MQNKTKKHCGTRARAKMAEAASANQTNMLRIIMLQKRRKHACYIVDNGGFKEVPTETCHHRINVGDVPMQWSQCKIHDWSHRGCNMLFLLGVPWTLAVPRYHFYTLLNCRHAGFWSRKIDFNRFWPGLVLLLGKHPSDAEEEGRDIYA